MVELSRLKEIELRFGRLNQHVLENPSLSKHTILRYVHYNGRIHHNPSWYSSHYGKMMRETNIFDAMEIYLSDAERELKVPLARD